MGGVKIHLEKALGRPLTGSLVRILWVTLLQLRRAPAVRGRPVMVVWGVGEEGCHSRRVAGEERNHHVGCVITMLAFHRAKQFVMQGRTSRWCAQVMAGKFVENVCRENV